MQVTDEMVEAALQKYESNSYIAGTEAAKAAMRAALEAALGARRGDASEIVEILRAGHPYSGTTDEIDLKAADCIEELAAALKPFSDIDGEGAEDFGDDTKVIVKFGRTTNYALKLGDLRRAHASTYRWSLK